VPLTLVVPRPDKGPLLAVEGVHKRYGDVDALLGVDVEIAEGEILALLGANGAGKTTLMSIIATLRRPDAGRVRVQGADALREPRLARRYLGYAPQDTGIYPTISVRQNLELFGELAGIHSRALRDRVVEVAEAVELQEQLPRPARTLSGGEARRLHTAMTLMGRAPLLLLDEPTVGVDVQTRGRLLEVVKGRADEGVAVCYSTHYLPEVEQLAASISIINGGRIVAKGTLEQLLASHAQSFVELCFNSTIPATLVDRADSRVTGDSTLTIATTEPPAVTAAKLLTQLGPQAQDLRAVKLVQPSLESVFLEVTERASTNTTAEATHVA
jgi:ABC-2 type transport system ATP-binding protein